MSCQQVRAPSVGMVRTASADTAEEHAHAMAAWRAGYSGQKWRYEKTCRDGPDETLALLVLSILGRRR